MSKVRCAISSVAKPMCSRVGSWKPMEFSQPAKSFHTPKNATNSRQRLTPVTISALVMGMLLTVISGLRIRFFMLKKPTAARAPTTVAMAVASRETRRVGPMALVISLSRNSSTYQSRVKPCQTVRLLESLNEKTISTKIGAYRNRNTNAMKNWFSLDGFFVITASPPVPHPRRSDSSPPCRPPRSPSSPGRWPRPDGGCRPRPGTAAQ